MENCDRARTLEQRTSLWEKESPLLSLVPIVGPYLAKRDSGLTGISVGSNGAVVEEYAHRSDGLTKVQSNCDGSVFSQYDPAVSSHGVSTSFEKMPTSLDREGVHIIEYDPARSDGALQRSESRFGYGGWVKHTFDPSRRKDGLVETLAVGGVLTEQYDPARAKETGLYERVYDYGNSESWQYKEGSRPNGLVKETRYKEPYGYVQEFAGRPDRLVQQYSDLPNGSCRCYACGSGRGASADYSFFSRQGFSSISAQASQTLQGRSLDLTIGWSRLGLS